MVGVARFPPGKVAGVAAVPGAQSPAELRRDLWVDDDVRLRRASGQCGLQRGASEKRPSTIPFRTSSNPNATLATPLARRR